MYENVEAAHELTSQKLLETQRDISVSIFIIFLEYVCHSFQNYAALHKQIKTHAIFATFVVRAIQQIHKCRAETVSEGDQSFGIFIKGDVATFIFIEAIEKGTPRGEEIPEAATTQKGKVSVLPFEIRDP